MKKVFFAAMTAVVFSCAMGIVSANAYNNDQRAKVAAVTAACACDDCTCDNCSCTDCTAGNCDANCCADGGAACCSK